LSPAQETQYENGLALENTLISDLLGAGFSQNQALKLIGLSKASFHYRTSPRPRAIDPVPHRRRSHPAALTAAEKDRIIESLSASGVSIEETYYRDLDQQEVVASLSSYHRVARQEGIATAATGSKRSRGPRAPRRAPVLVAAGPAQIACWDITYLPGPFRGVHYALYLIIDLFSRMILGWTIHEREDQFVAERLMRQVIQAHQGALRTVHSDNGAAMTSKRMKELLARNSIAQSLIRPSVSNDNAQCESFFRTVKYSPAWPGAFESIQAAEEWFGQFVEIYNHQHHHCGLAGFTPASVFDGTWLAAAQARQATLDSLYQTHPERYAHPPQIKIPPNTVTLNLAPNNKTHSPSTLAELLAS
jgi:putative transposase